MRYLYSALWLLISAGWLSAFYFQGSIIGGVEWLVHVGLGLPAGMNLLMAVLCLFTAICFLGPKRIPIALAAAVGVVTAVHLFNAIGQYLVHSTIGGILTTHAAVMIPFQLVGAYLPTNTVFTGRLSPMRIDRSWPRERPRYNSKAGMVFASV